MQNSPSVPKAVTVWPVHQRTTRTEDAIDPSDRAVIELAMRWCFGLTLLGFAVAGTTDTDIWGHMAIGLDMLKQGRFLWMDPYSFTHDQTWVNHEWLWDIIAASFYRIGGLAGLLLLRAALIGGVLWIVNRATSAAPSAVRILTLILVTFACLGQWHSTRPQIATLALYAVLLTNLTAWWLPLLFALWANVHGGWMFGLGTVGFYALTHPSRRSFVIAAACVLATLVNPYGWHLWLALADAIQRGWGDVSEWAPAWTGIAPLSMLLVLAAGLFAMRRRVSASLWAWSWTVLTFAAAAKSQRLMALAAVTGAVLLVSQWTPSAAVAITWTPARRAIACAALIFGLIMGGTFVQPTMACFPSARGWVAPEPEAVAFLRASQVRKAVVYFDFGEYAIFHLRGQMQVSMDNRRETVYSDALLQAQRRLMRGQDADLPQRIGADAIWWPKNGAALNGLEARGWHRRFEGQRTVVYLRESGPLVKGPAVSALPCFPHP